MREGELEMDKRWEIYENKVFGSVRRRGVYCTIHPSYMGRVLWVQM